MYSIISWKFLLLVTFLLTVLYFYFRRNYGYWKKRDIPYEKPAVLVGNLGHLMRISTFDFLRNLAAKHKTDYVGIFLGQRPALMVHSKELAKQILIKDFDNFQNRYSYAAGDDDPLGALNLFTLKNPLWSLTKQELAPMFTSSRLKILTELMNINSAELIQRIQTDYVENGKFINLKELFLMYTSDTIGYTVFGLKVSALKDLTSPLWYITQHMVKWTFWRGLELAMILFVPDVAKKMRSLVEQRRELTKSNHKDLFNHFMKLKENFKLPVDSNTKIADDLILAQAAAFIIGSIETSSATLSYCLHELAHNPEKQEKLYKEVSKAVKENGKTVLDYNDLMELDYLSSCIKETLRKYVPLPFLDRICSNRYKVNDEFTIEAGTPVFINIVAVHYNEENYPNPEKWEPERFEGTNDNDNKNFTFISFGEGRRACIGKRYGIMQVRTALAHMVMKYKFEPADPYLIKSNPYSVTLTPLDDGRVKFVQRT